MNIECYFVIQIIQEQDVKSERTVLHWDAQTVYFPKVFLDLEQVSIYGFHQQYSHIWFVFVSLVENIKITEMMYAHIFIKLLFLFSIVFLLHRHKHIVIWTQIFYIFILLAGSPRLLWMNKYLIRKCKLFGIFNYDFTEKIWVCFSIILLL